MRQAESGRLYVGGAGKGGRREGGKFGTWGVPLPAIPAPELPDFRSVSLTGHQELTGFFEVAKGRLGLWIDLGQAPARFFGAKKLVVHFVFQLGLDEGRVGFERVLVDLDVQGAQALLELI